MSGIKIRNNLYKKFMSVRTRNYTNYEFNVVVIIPEELSQDECVELLYKHQVTESPLGIGIPNKISIDFDWSSESQPQAIVGAVNKIYKTIPELIIESITTV